MPKNKIWKIYGEGMVNDLTSQKWYVKYRSGDFSLNNVQQWVRSY